MVWVLYDAADPHHHVAGPINLEWELGVFAFLEKDDAEHMVRLTKKDFGIAQEVLWDLRMSSAKSNIPLMVLNSENALDLFVRWPDRLSEYYGRA
jgi:hypothetical protein